MKILIFGANGMIGSFLTFYLKEHEIIPVTRKEYDINNMTIDSLYDFILGKEIDLIINCAGVVPSFKQRDLNSRLYFTVNSIFPIVLGTICKLYNIRMIHITTSHIFSGKRGNYTEKDIPDEIDDYGVSRSLGDLSNVTIIRTSVIGEEINNKRCLLEWIISNKGGEIDGYTNHFWNGITNLQLGKIIKQMIEENIFWRGVRHIFSPRKISKFELISLINNFYNLNINVKEKEGSMVDKTIKTVYDKIFDIPEIEYQLEELLSFRKSL